jgi:hypothetical protein
MRLQDKHLNVYERFQLEEQVVGPGGGHGRHNAGGSGGGAGRNIHTHVHLDGKQIAHVVMPLIEDHQRAQDRWQKIQAER